MTFWSGDRNSDADDARSALIEEALPEAQLRTLSDDLQLWRYVETSSRRDLYLQFAANARASLMLKKARRPPNPILMRQEVVVGLIDQDLLDHIRRWDRPTLYDGPKLLNVEMALAGIIVAMYLESLGVSYAA
jgi:hypothetical protein